MEVGFPTQKKIALIGQKVDATLCTVVSVTSTGDASIPFGSLLTYDDSNNGLCKIPTAKAHLDKPLGIALRDSYGQDYSPKSPTAALRQGRVWVLCKDDVLPGDPVHVVIGADGVRFTNKIAEGAIKLKCAIYLESVQSGLAPVEINFLGGAQ
jgi:hypothetical protein